jgi:membrane-bound lytic murein transglycosylase A
MTAGRHKWAWTLTLLLAACVTPPAEPPAPPPTEPLPAAAPFTATDWSALPDWRTTDLVPAWPALMQSCRTLRKKSQWRDACLAADAVDGSNDAAQRAFYETWFAPWQVSNPDGSTQGLITGYYEPRLYGSRTKTGRFRHPLYAVPDDLLTIDLSALHPQLKDLRLRGRVEGKRVVPYYTRAEIDAGKGVNNAGVLFWVDDAVALFFLQIQGSGRIELPDGALIKVGYADQNGHPYVSIGKKLVEAGEMKLEDASMQNIRAWGAAHPDKLPALLEQNPSYVFFRELPSDLTAPLGAMGLPLTAERSLAIDPRIILLGAPVFLATTRPNSNEAMNRLMLAQDTGGAIRGAVRGDFFWGFGDDAGALAGRMKQQGRMWVLYPKGSEPGR